MWISGPPTEFSTRAPTSAFTSLPGSPKAATREATTTCSFRSKWTTRGACSSVETDLKQQLSEAARLARLNSSSTLKEIEGFGDLVVLVNPAFEAELFREFPKRLDELQRQRKSFARNQRPVLLVVSSAGDGANHWLFPLGQGLNLLAQPLRIIRGPVAWYNHVVTVGNHLRFRTHAAKPILQLSSSEDQGKSEDNCFQGSLPCNYASCGCSRRFAEAFTADLPVGNDIFGNVRLTETGRLGVKHNPFWVIKADRGVVADHGDIFNPTFVSFLSELVARYASPEAEGEAVEGGSK